MSETTGCIYPIIWLINESCCACDNWKLKSQALRFIYIQPEKEVGTVVKMLFLYSFRFKILIFSASTKFTMMNDDHLFNGWEGLFLCLYGLQRFFPRNIGMKIWKLYIYPFELCCHFTRKIFFRMLTRNHEGMFFFLFF